MLAVAACAPTPDREPSARLSLIPVSFAGLAGWNQGAQGLAVSALRRSCGRLARRPDGQALGGGGGATVGATVGEWRGVCAAAETLDAADHVAARRFFEAWFRPHRAAAGDNAEGLFTGYYEAQLRGALRPGGAYRVPIYGPPSELVSADLGRFDRQWTGKRITGRVVGRRLVPFHTRGEIEKGALKGRGLELLWVDDPVDAFFLHVQGSGRVILEDGRVVRLGYAGRNGRAYVSIGRELVARGGLAKGAVSMQSIRAWLGANPAEAPALMARNPSFIFFRILDGDGPVGAQGAALTPGRSLAVDPRFVPLGIPLWLDTADPLDPNRPFRRLMIAQDTGSAIKGPVRGDIFFGYGTAAAARAGRMNRRGRYYLLLLKPRPG